MRVEALPKGDPNDNDNLRKFASAVLAAEPTAIGGPVSILKSGDTVVTAFIHAGIYALLVIGLLLWITLRRITDVLMTLVPLLVAGAVTLEICVLIRLPLNFANIVALPLLLGIGVAFKIYYVMAWRSGRTNLLQIEPDARDLFQRADDGDRVRQPVAVEPSRHVQHGQAAGAVAGDDACRRAAVSAGANGQTARSRGVGRCRRRDRRLFSDRAWPRPALFGAAVVGAGAPGWRSLRRRSGGLWRALGHGVGGARGDRRTNPGPGLAAAQEAEHAALDLELIGAARRDGRTIHLTIFRVVDLTFPLLGAGRLLHVDQGRHAQCRSVLF